mgnify:CR=1 FL=1
MSATVGEAWSVADAHGRNLHLRGSALDNRLRLAQGLNAVEHSGSCRAADGDIAVGNIDLVALSVLHALVDAKHNGTCAFGSFANNRTNASLLLYIHGEHVGVALHVGAVAGNADTSLGVEHERRCCRCHLNLLWHRNDVEVRFLSHSGVGQEKSHGGNCSCEEFLIHLLFKGLILRCKVTHFLPNILIS